MEKAYSLKPEEMAFMQQMRAEETHALAQFGAATLELQAAEKRLAAMREKEQTFVRTALVGRGVTNFETARVNGPNIECKLPDPPPAPAAPATEKPNGATPLPVALPAKQ